MEIKRHKTKIVKIGTVRIGGSCPVVIQSMAKTKTSDVENTIRQIQRLKEAGCEIVRLAVKDEADARAIKKIKGRVRMPIVADIHFHYRLAIEAIENGADKIRLNPGNIFKEKEIKEVIAALKQARIPLRVGVNSGSVRYLNSKGAAMADRLVDSALSYIRKIEKLKFQDIVVSLKASSVLDTLAAYLRMSKICAYPLHLGVTATGAPYSGVIKSSVALGSLLMEGIGDTIRVSLTAEPEEEVKAARYILESLGLRHFGPQIISCPTCGRCEVNLAKVVRDLESKLTTGRVPSAARPLKLAVMGCMVNGPGEAKEADLGVAFGSKEGLFFKKGRPIKKISFGRCVDFLLKEAEDFHALE